MGLMGCLQQCILFSRQSAILSDSNRLPILCQANEEKITISDQEETCNLIYLLL